MDHSESLPGSPSCPVPEELVRHACRHCGQISFCISESTREQEFNFTYDDVIKYARDGCDLFASRIMAHDFESFGTDELELLQLRVQIVWMDSTPNGTFHDISFMWMRRNEHIRR